MGILLPAARALKAAGTRLGSPRLGRAALYIKRCHDAAWRPLDDPEGVVPPRWMTASPAEHARAFRGAVKAYREDWARALDGGGRRGKEEEEARARAETRARLEAAVAEARETGNSLKPAAALFLSSYLGAVQESVAEFRRGFALEMESKDASDERLFDQLAESFGLEAEKKKP